MGVGPSATLLARPRFGRFHGKADVNQPTTLVECVENDPKRTLVGPCDRLVNFMIGWPALTCWPARSRTIQILFFDLEAGKYPPTWSLPPCAAMNMATADRQ